MLKEGKEAEKVHKLNYLLVGYYEKKNTDYSKISFGIKIITSHQ